MHIINSEYLIKINKKIGEKGIIINPTNLDFILDYANNMNLELKKTAYLASKIINLHIFEDGNKRTAAILITRYFGEKEIGYSPKKVMNVCINISKKNINDINYIKERIKNAIR